MNKICLCCSSDSLTNGLNLIAFLADFVGWIFCNKVFILFKSDWENLFDANKVEVFLPVYWLTLQEKQRYNIKESRLNFLILIHLGEF